ncbi:MAG: HNH endonuclease family protein [Bifidobacteriaceae bacterium]|jgi:hypothetical protein|nr:HNH endonuclease family protein [Bifidobacteriaceae bacterium]
MVLTTTLLRAFLLLSLALPSFGLFANDSQFTPAGTTAAEQFPQASPKPTDAGSLGLSVTFSPSQAKQALTLLDLRSKPATGYKRSAFHHWEQAAKHGWKAVPKGCNTRAATLYRDGQVTKVNTKCQVSQGQWRDPYTDQSFRQASQLDIDHVVPLAEAWRSGANQLSAAERASLANAPINLVAVSASQNRSKGDKSPAYWKPSNQRSWCAYAVRWIEVKTIWQLDLTSAAERTELGRMLNTCPSSIKGLAVSGSDAQPGTLIKVTVSAKSAKLAAKPTAAGNCPAKAPIKGNASSHIYHLPGGAYYSRTKAEQCFASEAAARKAGYRRSQR